MATALSEPITLRKKKKEQESETHCAPRERMNFLLHNILKINPISVGMLLFEDMDPFFSPSSVRLSVLLLFSAAVSSNVFLLIFTYIL